MYIRIYYKISWKQDYSLLMHLILFTPIWSSAEWQRCQHTVTRMCTNSVPTLCLDGGRSPYRPNFTHEWWSYDIGARRNKNCDKLVQPIDFYVLKKLRIMKIWLLTHFNVIIVIRYSPKNFYNIFEKHQCTTVLWLLNKITLLLLLQ